MLTLPAIELSGLWPFMGISALAILVLLVDLFLGETGRKLSIPLAVAGCLGLAVAVLGMKDEMSLTFMRSLSNSGITQLLTALFLIAAGLSLAMAGHPRFRAHALPGEVASLVLFSTAGMTLAVQASDLLVLFLGIELTSLPIYCLVGIRKHDKAANEAALKYFLMGAFSTAIFLFGFAIVFGTTGAFTFSGISSSNQEFSGLSYPFYRFGKFALMASLMFKAALVPFHMWAPDAYQGAPAPVAGFMSAAIKAMAVYVLFILSFTLGDMNGTALGMISVVSILAGNILALVQSNVKRMLAYSSIAHAGYLSLAWLAYPRLNAMTPLIYYLFGYTFMTIGAFGVAGWVAEGESGECPVDRLRGLWHRQPLAALALTLFMLGMAGIPPLAGFFGKFYIFRTVMSGANVFALVPAAIGSAIGVYYYLRVIVSCYMEEDTPGTALGPWPVSYKLALALCAAGTVALGLFPEPLLSAITSAVAQFQPY